MTKYPRTCADGNKEHVQWKGLYFNRVRLFHQRQLLADILELLLNNQRDMRSNMVQINPIAKTTRGLPSVGL